MTRYSVRVKPGTSQEKVVEGESGELTVYLRAKPVDGAANEALVRVLSKHFRVPKTSIRIVRGAGARNKLVEIP